MVFGILAAGILGSIIGGAIKTNLDATMASDKKNNKIVIALDNSKASIQNRYKDFPNKVPLDIVDLKSEDFYAMYNIFKNLLQQHNSSVVFAFYRKHPWQTEKLGLHLKIYLPNHRLYDTLVSIISKKKLINLKDFNIHTEITTTTDESISDLTKYMTIVGDEPEIDSTISLPPVQSRAYRAPRGPRDTSTSDGPQSLRPGGPSRSGPEARSNGLPSRSDGRWRGGNAIYQDLLSNNNRTGNIEFNLFNEFFTFFNTYKDNSEYFTHEDAVSAGPIYKSQKYHAFWMVPNVALDDLYGVCCELHNIVDSLFESVKSSFVDECRLGGLGNYAIYFKLIGPDKFNVCMKFAENIYPLLINKWFFTYTQSNKLYRYEINNGRAIKGPGYNYATHF